MSGVGISNVRTGQVMKGQVRTGQVRTCQVWMVSGQCLECGLVFGGFLVDVRTLSRWWLKYILKVFGLPVSYRIRIMACRSFNFFFH